MQVSQEIRNRIKLSVAAYVYEYRNHSIMTDHEFDELSTKVDLEVKTGNRKMDNFFKRYFEPATGMWIRKHPDKGGLEDIYQRYFNKGGEWYEML
jgi:hypothetical protein